MRKLALAAMLFPALVAAADEALLLERIERLEARIELLEQRLGADAPAEESERSGMVRTRYWLAQQSPFEDGAPRPLREGVMPLARIITLDPAAYGVEGGGLFSSYKDPSRFPVAALAIEGELLIKAAGRYRLVVKATPPREVGGAGNVEVGAALSLDGETVINLPPSLTLATRDKEITLPAGRVPLRLELLARSPGFGPSPTRTQVFIGLQAEGAIRPAPLSDFLAPARIE